MTDPEINSIPGTPDGSPPVPSVEPTEGATGFNPLTVGTELVNKDGGFFKITAVEPDKITVNSTADGSSINYSFSPQEWRSNISGHDSDWWFKAPTPDHMVWSEPALQRYLRENPEKAGDIKNNLMTLTNRTSDVESLVTAAKALELPGVQVVDMLRRNGFPDDTIVDVGKRYGVDLSEEDKKEPVPEAQKLLEDVGGLMEQAKQFQNDKGKLMDITEDNKEHFLGTMEALRAKINDFKETDYYKYGKMSLKVLLCLIAAIALFQLMMIKWHGGMGGKGR